MKSNYIAMYLLYLFQIPYNYFNAINMDTIVIMYLFKTSLNLVGYSI